MDPESLTPNSSAEASSTTHHSKTVAIALSVGTLFAIALVLILGIAM